MVSLSHNYLFKNMIVPYTITVFHIWTEKVDQQIYFILFWLSWIIIHKDYQYFVNR